MFPRLNMHRVTLLNPLVIFILTMMENVEHRPSPGGILLDNIIMYINAGVE